MPDPTDDDLRQLLERLDALYAEHKPLSVGQPWPWVEAFHTVYPDLAAHLRRLLAERTRWEHVRCLAPNAARCAREWEADHQRAAVEFVGLDPDEFRHGCDTILHVTEALVAARAERDQLKDEVQLERNRAEFCRQEVEGMERGFHPKVALVEAERDAARAEVERLRAALRPWASLCDYACQPSEADDTPLFPSMNEQGFSDISPTVGDCRRAKEVLGE